MTLEELKILVQDIVAESCRLRDKHISEYAPVNYACIFSQSREEYKTFLTLAEKRGHIVRETRMGPVFQIKPIVTVAGKLHLLKIREPDPEHLQRGDTDFTLSDYATFKKQHLGKPGFSLIEREDMEIIELADPDFNVLVYFSHPPLWEVLQLKI